MVTQIGETSRGTAINNLGQVAGYGFFDGKLRAFLYADGIVTELGTSGGDESSAWGINDSGQVVGWANDDDGNSHAFRCSDGQMQDLGTLGGTLSQAGAINNWGHVVGSASVGDGGSPAFIYHDDQMFELGTLAGGDGFANGLGINDAGQVAGVSQLAPGSGVAHAFLYSGGKLTDLTPLGGQSSARGINELGQVVGASDGHAFLYTNGEMLDLGTLGGVYSHASSALGINDLGHVVGWSASPAWAEHAFLYENGLMTDLNDLISPESGWVLTVADDINNLGQIVGEGVRNGQNRAFLLTPVPAPSVFTFYNNSAWDDGDGAANAADDEAIASKVALRPGIKATCANYTSYDKGINGLMIDVYDLPGTPTVNDFLFRVGNNDKPYGNDLDNPDDDWSWAPDPTAIAVRPGAGQDGADRVTLIWEDGVIRNCWLQVTVLATDTTGLSEDIVFYVGNAVGESGNSTTDAVVNATDEVGARNNPHGPFSPAAKEDAYDYNRDQLVNATDQIIARNNRTSPFTALKLITPPVEPGGGEGE